MRKKTFLCVAVSAAIASLGAATVERMFRPERHSRGDTNVRVQQPIDEAAWIWAKGCDVWGGAVFSETRTTPETLAKIKAEATAQLDKYSADTRLIREWHLCGSGSTVTLHRLVLVFHGGDCVLAEEL